ncbi:MAG: TIGR02757 family protein [Spirochaetales bacterium]|nr:TIGR02757 family protein [Spirochaetales bacterium]
MPGKKNNIREFLDHIYDKYNHRGYVTTDPIQFVHSHADASNYELMGLVAASLAYGRVAQICKSIAVVLHCMTLTPECLIHTDDKQLIRHFTAFKHRFTPGEEISAFFIACKKIYKLHGSLENCFLSHYKETDTTFIPALTGFVGELKSYTQLKKLSLIPDPEKNSACKRLHLFLRWMVRKDEIDPGPWSDLPASKLIIPLDTHMHRIGHSLGFTQRKQADIKTALEITGHFKTINPEDPVKYDFALTRMGMKGEKIILQYAPLGEQLL